MQTRKATRTGPHAANGLVIFNARQKKKLTQEALAGAVGISRIQQIKLENGMHLPKRDTRDRLAERLGVKKGAIRCEEDARESDPFRGRPRSDVHGRSGAGGGARVPASDQLPRQGINK